MPIAKVKRELLFVPPSMPALELLLKMQTTHIHLALVIDEYGGTDGLVSIEDLIEEIVGDIDDEHDVEEAPQLKVRDDGGYDADARLDLEDFKEQTGIDLAPEDGDEEIDTLGGLAVSLVGRVPQRGEIIQHPSGFDFEIVEADPRRVKKLRLRPYKSRTMLARSEGAQDALVRIGDFLRTATGWRRAAIAFAAGALSALAFAPFEIFPLFLIAVAVLVLLIDGAEETKRPMRSAHGSDGAGRSDNSSSAFTGWLTPSSSKPKRMPGRFPSSNCFCPAGSRCSSRWPARSLRASGSRARRGFSFSRSRMAWPNGCADISSPAFPWNLPAYGWGASLGVLQSTALFGSYGLSLLTILFGASLAQLRGARRARLAFAGGADIALRAFLDRR